VTYKEVVTDVFRLLDEALLGVDDTVHDKLVSVTKDLVSLDIEHHHDVIRLRGQQIKHLNQQLHSMKRASRYLKEKVTGYERAIVRLGHVPHGH